MKWPEYALSQLSSSFISGGTPSTKVREYWEGEIPWITGADIVDGEVCIGRRYINESAVSNSATNIVPERSLLIVTRTGVGKIAIAPVDIAISQDLTGIVLKKSIDPKFALAAIRSRMGVLLAAQRGATIKGVTRDAVKRLTIPLPPLSEQRRIVEILDQADALRKKRAEADAKTARILPALFYKMFGDPATNLKGWPIVRLDELGTPLSGGGFPRDEQGFTEGEVPFIKVSDMNTSGNEVFIRSANHWVSKDTLRRLRVRAAPAGTTIFPKIGVAVATNKKRLLVRDTAYDNNVIGVIPKEPELSTYIYTYFLLFDLRRLARTTAVPSIKTSELAALPMPKPESNVVYRFNKQFKQLLSLEEMKRHSGGQISSLFEVLLHRAFTGDLTAKWREAHMKELLQEIEQQAQVLGELGGKSI